MSQPVVAQKGHYEVEVEAGKKYAWCACGKSENQPFCDGAHSGGEFKPVVWAADETKTVHLCGCKHSGDKPYCDGSHRKL